MYSSGLIRNAPRLDNSWKRSTTRSARLGASKLPDRECMAMIVLKLPAKEIENCAGSVLLRSAPCDHCVCRRRDVAELGRTSSWLRSRVIVDTEVVNHFPQHGLRFVYLHLLRIIVEKNRIANAVGPHRFVSIKETVLHLTKDSLGAFAGVVPIRFHPAMQKNLEIVTMSDVSL